jgi:hypothetical protein
MTRKRVNDTPDAVLSSDTGQAWIVFCTLCTRALGGPPLQRADALYRAHEHLEHSHGLLRVFVFTERPGYRRAVDVALPLVVAHDLTLPADRHAR